MALQVNQNLQMVADQLAGWDGSGPVPSPLGAPDYGQSQEIVGGIVLGGALLLALADGPFPVGDAIAAGLVGHYFGTAP